MNNANLEMIDECLESTFNNVKLTPMNRSDPSTEDANADDNHMTTLDTMRDVMIINDPIAPVWSLDDFEIGRKLGEGQFGAVYLARERRTGYIVAIKAIKKVQLLHTRNEHLLRREIEIHSHLIHPHILGFYGWFTTNHHICLIVEIAPKGELMDQLRDGGLPEPVVSRYMMQMISAIRTCHRFNVMHRDLKPENVLVDLQGNLKLADFGWAAHIPDPDPENLDVLPLSAARRAAEASSRRREDVSGAADLNPAYRYLKTRRKTYCGTLDYLSPEICRHEWYGKEVDLWCLGILCYELATGGPPFSHDSYREKGQTEEEARKQQQIDIQKTDISQRLRSYMSDQMKDFLLNSLHKDPCKRLTTKQMLNHPFITRYNDIQNELDAEKYFEEDRLCKEKEISGLRDNETPTPTPTPAASQKHGGAAWLNSRLFISAASSPHSENLRCSKNAEMSHNSCIAFETQNLFQTKGDRQFDGLKMIIS